MTDRIELFMKQYPQLQMELACLKRQLCTFTGITEEEMISCLTFEKKEGERVQESRQQDKTGNIALIFRAKMEKCNDEWYDYLLQRYMLLKEEMMFFDSAVSALPGILPDLMADMLQRTMTWEEVADKYHVSRSMVAKHRRRAVKELEKLYHSRERELARYMLD